MQLSNIRYESREGRAALLLNIDGTETVIGAEQKYLLISNGIVYAGAAMSDKVSTVFRGRAVPGASDDPALVKLVTDFVLSVRNNTFQPSVSS